MNKTKVLSQFIIFLVLISHVYAQYYSLFSGKFYDFKEGEEKIEFEFYNNSYNICENEKKTIPILVINEVNIDNKYSLEALGANWIKLSVKEFSLTKKQSGVVFLELNPNQNTNGRYNIKVNGVSSVGNIKKELILDINVEKCYSLKLELEKEEEKVCGGVKKQYVGEITNDGKQKIDIELSVKGPNWLSIDKNTFSVDVDDIEEFEINADIPANAKGVFNAIVTAVINNFPSIKSEETLSIEVVPKYDCYKADVITDAKIINYYSNEYIPIKIRNSGIRQAEYEISLEAPNWVEIEPKKLIINPEQLGNFNLNIKPNVEVPEGTYSIKIIVKIVCEHASLLACNFEDIVYTKNIEIVLSKKQFLKGFKSFFVFYQYYIYVILFIAIILFIFRRQITNKIKTTYKNYRIRKARLRALEAARKARQIKRKIKSLEKTEFEVRKTSQYWKKWTLFFIILTVVVSLLFFSIYQFNFPISKDFVKVYYLYFIAGILISLFIIFLIEFYKPLFKLLRKIDKKRKK